MEFFIVIRQLTLRWWQTLLTVGSVAIGVMILITALSLTNGFSAELVDKILGTSHHITMTPGFMDKIYNYENVIKGLKKNSHIKSVLPYIKGQALITDSISTQGTLLSGIDPAIESQFASWQNYLIKGSLPASEDGYAVVGSELAKKMGLRIGDSIQLITGIGKITVLQISGLFQSGFYEIDARIVYVNLEQARELFNYKKGEINTILMDVDNVFSAPAISDELRTEFKAYNLRSWDQNNKILLKAMALEKKVIFLVILFIIIVAMMGVVNMLTMSVIQKTPEISILRAMGVTKVNIGKIFLLEGIMIGAIGVFLGCILGLGLSWFLSFYPLNLPNDVYYIDKLPVKILFTDFIFVVVFTFIICILFSFIPAYRATKFDPIEILRRHY